MITTAASVKRIPLTPKARAVTVERVAGRPTVLTHSASRCDAKAATDALNRSSTVPPRNPALDIAAGSASMPTPMLVFARLAMHATTVAPVAPAALRDRQRAWIRRAGRALEAGVVG